MERIVRKADLRRSAPVPTGDEVLTQADQKVARARAAYVLPRGVSKARGLSVPQMRRVFPALLGLAVVLREREVLREDAASRLGGPPVTTRCRSALTSSFSYCGS